MIFAERTDKKWTKPVIQTIRISNNFLRKRPEMTEWEEICGDVSFYGSTYQILYDYGAFKIKNPARGDKKDNREDFYLATDPTIVKFFRENNTDFVIVTEKNSIEFVSCESGKVVGKIRTDEPFEIVDGIVTLEPT